MRKMIILLLVVLPLPVLGGDGSRGFLGGQFQVNTYTSNDQTFPAVSIEADSDFVVVWQSDGSSGSDTSFYSIQGQRYASDGSTRGNQFQINVYTNGSQGRPAIDADTDGDFVVVWQSGSSGGSDTSSFSVQGQRYASDGSTQGGQFQVNTYTTQGQFWPSVGVGPDGDFVVTWWSYGSGGSDTSYRSVQGQRYASDGTTRGGQFQVNTYTTYSQEEAAVDVEADDDFIVTWVDTSFGHSGIRIQRYASDGTARGDEFQVNTDTAGSRRPAVGIEADGDFVVAWDSADIVSMNVNARRFASDGTPRGDQFQVNTYTIFDQLYVDIGVAADGHFAVVWHSGDSAGSDTSGFSIQAQRYTSGGTAQGGQFQINAYTTGNQQQPALGVAPDGDFVVVWRSDGSNGSDTSGSSIQGQRFSESIFSDGFESGDATAWLFMDQGP